MLKTRLKTIVYGNITLLSGRFLVSKKGGVL
jgi:hypothetical protein